MSPSQAGAVEEERRGRLEEQTDPEAGIRQGQQRPAHPGGGAVLEEGTVSTALTPHGVA